MTNVFHDLSLQWSRLCDGHESATDVAASLDAWRRDCHLLRDVNQLDHVVAMIHNRQHSEALLRYLIDRAHHGDQIAHRTVLQAYLPALASGARRSNHGHAEELLTDAWNCILRAPLRPDTKLATWLGLQIRHTSTDQNPHEITISDQTPLPDDPTSHAPAPDSNLMFTAMLTPLSAVDRQLLTLLFVDGYRITEAATLLDLTASAAAKRRDRAYQRLRAQMRSDDEARAVA